MENQASLHPSQEFYVVTYDNKTYHCKRVTQIIESTHPTPKQIKQWIVNCAVDYLLNDHTTTDIKELKANAWAAHQVVSQQALDDGSEAHDVIHTGNRDSLSDAARACMRGYDEFVAKFIPVRIAAELTIYDTKNLIAGTIDDLSLKGGDKGKLKTLYMIDWKTSKAIQHSYKIQICVYKWMLLNFIKAYLKNPANYDLPTQKIMNTIVMACGKKPKIKPIIVRLNKKPKARILHETYEISAKEEKALMAEFSIALKLHNKRKEQEHGNAR